MPHSLVPWELNSSIHLSTPSEVEEMLAHVVAKEKNPQVSQRMKLVSYCIVRSDPQPEIQLRLVLQ